MLRHHLDPNNHNGAVFLGLNGLVVKSHGSATDKGVANAIRVAARMVREDITRKIAEDLDNLSAHAQKPGREMSRARSSPAPARRCRRGASPTPSSPSGSTRRRMDRRAHRHPRPPHRRRRRDHGDASRPRRRARRSPPPASARRIGLIVLATATPDQTFPASATKVQTALGIDDCIAFDVAAVCTGFLYALSGRRQYAEGRAWPIMRW
jgi:hypothetical protein